MVESMSDANPASTRWERQEVGVLRHSAESDMCMLRFDDGAEYGELSLHADRVLLHLRPAASMRRLRVVHTSWAIHTDPEHQPQPLTARPLPSEARQCP